MVRTSADFRCGHGDAIGGNAYRLTIDDTNEAGTVQHFLSEAEVEDVYGRFSELSFDLAERTFAQRTRRDSDWLITVRK